MCPLISMNFSQVLHDLTLLRVKINFLASYVFDVLGSTSVSGLPLSGNLAK